MPAKKTSKKPQNATPKLIVHMVRTENVAIELMESIHDRISVVLGPISYRYDAGRNLVQSGSEQLMSWDAIFALCEAFRTKHQIPADEVVELFIDKPNECNWFASWDRSAKLNFFIHTKGYEHIIDADPEYPLVYELATVPMLIQAFDNLEQAENYAHEESRGCVFDYTRNKKEAMLRLRTADLCPECIQLFENRKADAAILQQSLAIFDLIRSQMLYKTRFSLLKNLSRLTIYTESRQLLFNDAHVHIKLGPREMAVYHFLLENPDGKLFAEVAYSERNKPDFEEKKASLMNEILMEQSGGMKELWSYYKTYSSANDVVIRDKAFLKLLDLREQTEFSGVISKINRKINDSLNAQISQHYIIQHDAYTGIYKIKLDRKLVRYIND